MADPVYMGLTPTSLGEFDGSQGSVLGARQFLEYMHWRFGPGSAIDLTEVEDEVITIPSTYKVRLQHVSGDELLSAIGVYAGLGQTGQQYTVINSRTAFTDGGGSFEARYYRETGELEFDSAVVSVGQTLYATYGGAHSPVSAFVLAKLWAETRASQQRIANIEDGTTNVSLQETAVASENLANRTAYLQDNGTLAALADGDLDNIDRIDRAVYVSGSYTTGQTVTYTVQGPISKPSWQTGLFPPGRMLWIGRNGKLTWDGDPTNGLVKNDFIRPVGRSFNREAVFLDLLQPVQGAF